MTQAAIRPTIGFACNGAVELPGSHPRHLRSWAGKATEVRRWFVLAASKRWPGDGGKREHCADSGGKSGGRKEKLADTILAASLAHQFGLEWGAVRSRSTGQRRPWFRCCATAATMHDPPPRQAQPCPLHHCANPGPQRR